MNEWKHRITGWLQQARSSVQGRFSGSSLKASWGRKQKMGVWLIRIFAVYLVLVLGMGVYWSVTPDEFTLDEATARHFQQDLDSLPIGVATTATFIEIVSTLLEKRGGYLSNDIMPPGAYLDNIPSWEYGVVIQSRDFSKAMREAFSRSQSQSREDKSLALAESLFNFDHRSWVLPSTENEYQEGIGHLNDYLQRLADPQESHAQFFARADNLRYWLGTVETRLGSLSQRLTASVGQKRINTDLAGESSAVQSTQAPKEMIVKTPWSELDDVFYESRGSAWALIHLLKAVDHDFAQVLEQKNARVSIRQIIRELEHTQSTLYSPMILNGSGFGVLANHSLVMASYLSRANAALIDLRELLDKG